MSTPLPVVLDWLTPAAEDGWHTLFDLADIDDQNWVLIGGQMVSLLAVEGRIEPTRVTDDVDVLVNVRARPRATEWLAQWLTGRGFDLEGISADGIGNRFIKPASAVGTVMFDILAPEGIGARASKATSPPARTVEAPGSTQALERSSLIAVTVAALVPTSVLKILSTLVRCSAFRTAVRRVLSEVAERTDRWVPRLDQLPFDAARSASCDA